MSKAELKRHKSGKWKDQSITHLKNALKKQSKLNSSMLHQVPFSNKLKEYIPLQWEVYKARKGQVHESAE
jgi:hypothetical protein